MTRATWLMGLVMLLAPGAAGAGGLASVGDLLAGDRPDCSNADEPCPLRGGLYFRYEMPILDLDFDTNTAYVEEDFFFSGESGQPVEYNYKDEVSHRIDFGYAPVKNGLGWRARYWHFDEGATEQGSVPIDGDIEVSVVDDPDIEITNVEALLAEQDVEVKVWDFDLLARHDAWDTAFTAGVGLRWARLDMGGRYRELAPTPGDQYIEIDNTYEGVGPTISFAMTRPILTGWLGQAVRLFTNARGSFMIGDADYEAFLREGGSIDDRLEVDEEDDFVPALDVQAGIELAWDSALGTVAVRGGWEGQYWFGVGTTGVSEGTSGDSDDFQDMRDADMSFNGAFVSLEIRR